MALAALALAACGGERSPTRLPTVPLRQPEAAIRAGTVLTVRAGETGEAVSGATVQVASASYTTDERGQAVLAEDAGRFALVEIRSPASLDRLTLLRSAEGAEWTLWPRRSPTGLDEAYTAELVYGWGEAEPGAAPLYRISAEQAVIVPSGPLQADPAAMAAHQRAADEVTAATGGRLRFTVSPQAPAGGVAFDTRIDPEDEDCEERTLAVTTIRVRNEAQITGGGIVFCRPEAARDATVTHELGHAFGLSHSPDPTELMNAIKRRGQAEGFGAREALAMQLMLQRPGGNRYPDNDRSAAAAQGLRSVRVVCR